MTESVSSGWDGKATAPCSGILLIGVGNEFRNDDALGLLIAREFKRRCPEGLAVLENDGDGTSIVCALQEAREAVVVDAVRSGAVPGTIHRLDMASQEVPTELELGTSHSFGVAEAVETARKLRCLPRHVILCGIEGATFELGRGLSDPVLKSVPRLISMIEAELRALLSPETVSATRPS
jgi:hydrogenase maturation protease